MTSVSYLIPEAAMVGIPTACTMPTRKSETHCNTLQHTAQRELGCQTHTADTATHCTTWTWMPNTHCRHCNTLHNADFNVRNTLQHAVLQHTATCNMLYRNTLQDTAQRQRGCQTHYNTLHSADLNVRNTLQHTVLQHTAPRPRGYQTHTATYCKTSPHTATLHHTETHCTTLKHTPQYRLECQKHTTTHCTAVQHTAQCQHECRQHIAWERSDTHARKDSYPSYLTSHTPTHLQNDGSGCTGGTYIYVCKYLHKNLPDFRILHIHTLAK